MCIAIYIPAGEDVKDEALIEAQKSNPHGNGLVFLNQKTGKLNIYRDMKFDRFMEKFRRLQKENPESNFIVHLRKKTHGEATIENCHPFKVNNGCVFVHNGQIHPEKPADVNGELSDTRLFNENVLKKLPQGWQHNPGIVRLIEDYIGASRLAVMDSKGEVVLFNETAAGSAGPAHWADGVWYSNEYYKKKTPPQRTGSQTTRTAIGGGTRSQYPTLESLGYPAPEGATHVNTMGYPAKYDYATQQLLAWAPFSSEWRVWDREKNWWKRGKDGQPIKWEKPKTEDECLPCEGCKEWVVWYDLDFYVDEWANDYHFCRHCATQYRAIGVQLRKSYKQQQQAQ